MFDAQGVVLDSTLSLTAKNERLKALGLRAVNVGQFFISKYMVLTVHKNAFWSVANSDPHEASAFDELHANAAGLGGKHLWPELQKHIEQLGRSAIGKVDRQYVPFI